MMIRLYQTILCWRWIGAALLLPLSAWAQSADPSSPEAELASMRIADGFEVRLFASERDGIFKPIQIRFDGDGRLWVAGSTVYPQIEPGQKADDKVWILEDTDGDGRSDKTIAFADGLLIPTGLELGDGGAYVGSATQLLHLRDTNGDGRADERRVIFSGFGTGDAHQTLNSFTWGPSGELMMSQGLHADSRIETPWGIERLEQAGVWRFWPKRLRLDAFWTGAMGAHNPFGNVFDRWGQPFVFAGNGHGIYHLTQAMIRTEHFLLQPALWNQGRKFGGADFVENSHWPEANQGEVIAGSYLNNAVDRFRITPAGSTFHVERLQPLIESTNTAFRIVDTRFGPDGALYLCDWYNPIIGHYQASFRHPDRDKVHGRIWRVTAKGRPLVQRPKLEHASVDALLGALTSNERWNRLLAKRILRDRDPATVTNALARWVSQLDPKDSRYEHHLFEALGVYASQEAIEPGLLDKLSRAAAPEARAFAARVTGEWADRLASPLDLLERLAGDPSSLVRLEVVVACSYVKDPRAVETAMIVADQALEPPIEYALTQTVNALRPIWLDAQRRGKLTFGGNAQRAAVFARIDGSADSVKNAVARLQRRGEVALNAQSLEGLMSSIAMAGGPSDLALLLPAQSYRVGVEYQPGLHAKILEELEANSRLRKVTPSGDLAATLKPLVESKGSSDGDGRVRAQAIRLAGLWRIGALRPDITTVAGSKTESTGVREAALAALADYNDPAALESLKSQIRAADSSDLTAAAIVALATVDSLDAANRASGLLADQARPVSEPAAEKLFRGFLARPAAVGNLRSAVAANPIRAENARVGLKVLAASGRSDPELVALLSRQAQLSNAPKALSPDEIPKFVAEVMKSGDAKRGAEIFNRPQLNCSACHATGPAPEGIGPNLSTLGTAQTPEFIVGAILQPQKEVKEGFMAQSVTLKDGDEYQGYIVRDGVADLLIKDVVSRKELTIAKTDIAEQRQLGSLMPSGLADSLTWDEFRDLVRFLISLGRK